MHHAPIFRTLISSSLCLWFLATLGCAPAPADGKDGADGKNALLRTSSIPAGDLCSEGGTQLDFGLDKNADGELDDDEVTNSHEICNGSPGQDGSDGDDGYGALTQIDDEVGASCDSYGAGGQRIRTGQDNGDGGGIAGNGVLEDGEVDSTTYICNGATGQSGVRGPPGQNGSRGAPGSPGAAGPPGESGSDGNTALIQVNEEAPGENCPAGGQRFETGLDDGTPGGTAGDGILDEEEIDRTVYVCNGETPLVPLTIDEVQIEAGTLSRDEGDFVISRDMMMLRTEVTQALWTTLSGGVNPSEFTDCDSSGGESCPVERVDWYSAVAFANALSERNGLEACYVLSGCTDPENGWMDGVHSGCNAVAFTHPTDPLSCTGYRLPTEAEWEYAYRAGTTTAHYNGDSDDNLGEIAWSLSNADDTTHPVAQKTPNAWGLYDMSGNVVEWTHDGYGNYPNSAVDYTGPESAEFRIFRGGSWFWLPIFARADYRAWKAPDQRTFGLDGCGFRLTRTTP